MRNIKFLAILAVVTLFAFTSCNKEKPADKVDGAYKGYTLASSNFFSEMFDADQSLTLTKVAENTVDVNYSSSTWGTFTISGAVVEGKEAPFTLSGNGSVKMSSMQGEMKEYACSLTATVYGANSDKNVFTFNVPGVMGGTKVVFYTDAPSLAYYVAGNYDGTVAYGVGGTDYDPVDATVKLTKSESGKVNIALPEIGSGQMSIPALEINDVEVTTTDNVVFTLVEKEVSLTVGSVTYAGKVSGTYTNDNLTLNYSLKPGAMPMYINFVFTGKK